MKELIPGTGKLTPAGSGGAGTVARGNRTADRAMLTLRRIASCLPPISPMAAAATETPAVSRNARRAGAAGDRAGTRSAGTLAPGGSGAVTSPGCPGSPASPGVSGRSGARSSPPSGPPNTIGGSPPEAPAAPGLPEAPAALPRETRRAAITSRYSANAPAAAPTTVGNAHPAVAFGLVSAAARPMTAKIASPKNPYDSRRIATTPTTIEYRKTTTTTPVSSAFLSLLPNVVIAQFLTGSGVRLIATCPTAITGEAFGIDTPATSCAIPIATAAASTPQTAPQAAPTRPALAVMQVSSDDLRLALREAWLRDSKHYSATLPDAVRCGRSGDITGRHRIPSESVSR